MPQHGDNGVRLQRLQYAEAVLLAETGAAVAVRLDRPRGRPIGGRRRDVVVYTSPAVPADRIATLLRDLADELDDQAATDS